MIEKKYIEMKEPFSGNRVINIYLPNDYNERRKKYPVLYMFDGHNLFFDEEAAFGKSWGMKEYLEDNDTQLIVVGIQCSFEGNERMSEPRYQNRRSQRFQTVKEPEDHACGVDERKRSGVEIQVGTEERAGDLCKSAQVA